jgi:biopolymer transport protein ExbB
LTLYDKDTSIKQGEIDEAIVSVTSNKVLLQMQSALVKYQAVKKEGFNSEEAAETIQRNRRGYFT